VADSTYPYTCFLPGEHHLSPSPHHLLNPSWFSASIFRYFASVIVRFVFSIHTFNPTSLFLPYHHSKIKLNTVGSFYRNGFLCVLHGFHPSKSIRLPILISIRYREVNGYRFNNLYDPQSQLLPSESGQTFPMLSSRMPHCKGTSDLPF